MHPDDVKAALDALASEEPEPKHGASDAVARGRTRVTRRRIALAGVALALIAAAAAVGTIAGSDDNGQNVASVPTTSTRAPSNTTPPPPTPEPGYDVGQYDPQPIAIGSANEIWICGDPMQLSVDRGKSWHEVKLPARRGAAPIGEYVQPTLCTAAPGAAWSLRATGLGQDSELLRIDRATRHVEAFPLTGFGPVTIEAITFVDADVGWLLAEYNVGDPTGTLLYVTHDGGKNWESRAPHTPLTLGLQGLPAPDLLAFANENNGWGLGPRALLERTDDGGYTWREVEVPTIAATGDFPKFLNGVFASGDTVVAWGGTGQPLGNTYKPFFDVSTDGGQSWTMRSGPPNLDLPLSLQSAFATGDATHWLLATDNRLFATDDGGRTWSLRAQFAGTKRLRYLAVKDAETQFAAGYGDQAAPSSVVLETTDAGANWTTVNVRAPPQNSPTVAPFAGGIVGCPTRPLTKPAAGTPPPGLVDAARRYMGSTPQTVGQVYRVGANPKGSFGSLFKFQVGSCGPATVANAWVVELYGPIGQGGGGSTDQTQLALAHSADGWHVFGRYH